MINVLYSDDRQYLQNRPYSEITLLGVRRGNPSVNFKALVDTGADYLQLPASAASTVGIDLNNNGILRTVHGATGTSNMIFVTGIKIEVEGKEIEVDAFFDPLNASSALLGRQALLTALEAGFNASAWLWKY